jgi:hypothetical protein
MRDHKLEWCYEDRLYFWEIDNPNSRTLVCIIYNYSGALRNPPWASKLDSDTVMLLNVIGKDNLSFISNLPNRSPSYGTIQAHLHTVLMGKDAKVVFTNSGSSEIVVSWPHGTRSRELTVKPNKPTKAYPFPKGWNRVYFEKRKKHKAMQGAKYVKFLRDDLVDLLNQVLKIVLQELWHKHCRCMGQSLIGNFSCQSVRNARTY